MTAIVIPWTGGDTHRVQAFAYVQKWWKTHLDLPIFIGGGESRAAAKNAGMRAMEQSLPNWHRVVFTDADCFCPPNQVIAAARSLGLVVCSTKLQKFSRKQTETLYETGQVPVGKEYNTHIGGIVSISRRAWETIGGYDERFTTWGGEDSALWFASEALVGPVERIPGMMWHLWHPKSRDSKTVTQDFKRMKQLALRYKRAAGHAEKTNILPETKETRADPEAMRSLLFEPFEQSLTQAISNT